ncbi:MAG: YcaO-like family protein, partial [Pseudomonadota bacterium]
GSFVATTNGLASGNTLDEAVCHGLFEVIERDATTLWRLSDEASQAKTSLDPASIDDPICRGLLDKFAAAEIDVAIWDVTTDVGIATFKCMIAGRNDGVGAPEVGAGTHLSREVALSRALTEAAQARTTYISGARDDITAEQYRKTVRDERLSFAREVIENQVPVRKFSDVPTTTTNSFADDLEVTVEALANVGIEEILMVDLTKPDIGVAVVRMVVPGLEAALEGPDSDYVPGERAAKLVGAEP